VKILLAFPWVGILLGEKKPKEIKGATGAGDAFMAGLVDCYLKNKTLEETTIYATAASYVALSSYSTINPLMTVEEVQRIINSVTIDLKEF